VVVARAGAAHEDDVDDPVSNAFSQGEKRMVKAVVDIDAGVCGFKTSATVRSEDSQRVVFEVTSDCENIRRLAVALKDREPIDAYQEISPAAESVLLRTVRSTLTGCCAGCAVPVGLFKAMQVATGLALPKDIRVRMTKG
jgi:hypothetical protein